MSVADHVNRGPVAKQRVHIVTVDPAQRIIKGALKDGGGIDITVWDIPNTFRWPAVGEVWLVRYDQGYWFLDSMTQVQPDKAIESMVERDALVNSPVVYESRGYRLAPVDLTHIENNDLIVWDSTKKVFIPGAGGGGGQDLKTFIIGIDITVDLNIPPMLCDNSWTLTGFIGTLLAGTCHVEWFVNGNPIVADQLVQFDSTVITLPDAGPVLTAFGDQLQPAITAATVGANGASLGVILTK